MRQKVVKKNAFLRLPCTPNGSSHGGHPKKSPPTTPEELTAGFSFERAIDFIKVAKTLMIPPASLQTLLPIHCSIFAGISMYFSEIYLKKYSRIQTSQWVSCRMLSLPIFISIELLLWWRWILHTMFVQKHRNMFVKHHLAIWVAFAHLQVFKCCRLFCQTDIPQLQWNLNTPSSPGSAWSFAVKPRRGIANTFLSGASFISFCISVDMIHSACPIFADKFPIYLMQQHGRNNLPNANFNLLPR